MFNQKGFSKIVLIVIIFVLTGGTLGYVMLLNNHIEEETESPTETQRQISSSVRNNSSLDIAQTNRSSKSSADNFKSGGELIRNNSIWNFTAHKYDPKADSWSTDGPYKLKFTDNSICQSVVVESRKCANFIFTHDRYNAVEIEGTKKDNEVTVSSLMIIQ